MEKQNGKKRTKSAQLDDCRDFGIAMRSIGILLPETDSELQSLKEIIGNSNGVLPERFKNMDFVFEKKTKRETILIMETTDRNALLSYAARDGQENLPEHILNKMKGLKNALREKKKVKNKNK